MRVTSRKLLPKLVVISTTFMLLGCSSAINPWYKTNNFQKKQAFVKRYPVRENAFVANGGLSKKHQGNPFTAEIGESGFYSANPSIKPINKTTGMYKNPLSGVITRQEAIIKEKDDDKPTLKGAESSIVNFFKKGVSKTKSFLKGGDTDEATQDTQSNQAPSESKRVPIGNNETESEHITNNLGVVEQGGSTDFGYTYYDLAEDLPKSPQSIQGSGANALKKPKVLHKNIDFNGPVASEQSTQEVKARFSEETVIYSPIPEKTEFDEYYLEENKSRTPIANFVKKYMKKASSIFKFSEANAAEVSEHDLHADQPQTEPVVDDHLSAKSLPGEHTTNNIPAKPSPAKLLPKNNLKPTTQQNHNDHQAEFEELNKSKLPVISDEDMVRARSTPKQPQLKDVPPVPEQFKNLDTYHQEIKRLDKEVAQ